MGSMLIVDGETTPNVDREAIKCGFESIEPSSGWIKSLSIVEVRRDELHSLIISGHPIEGWGYFAVEDGDCEMQSFPTPSLTQDKAIEIAQSYNSGDVSWMSEFKWERQKTFRPTRWTAIRNLAFIVGVFAVFVFLLRWFRRL